MLIEMLITNISRCGTRTRARAHTMLRAPAAHAPRALK